MPNSRDAFMAKRDLTLPTTGTVTFSPSFGCNTHQIRMITNGDPLLVLTVRTIDEDGIPIQVDGSPFSIAGGDFDADDNAEITIDTSNPSISVELTGAGTATVKCKSYRTLEDSTRAGAYTTI